MGTADAGVDGQIGRGSGIGLHIHAPLVLVQVEQLATPLLGEQLHAVDELVATVVPGNRRYNQD